MAKINLDGILSGFKSVAKIIANFTSIETALNDKVLYRDNPEGEPNQMENNLDMNGNRITNLPTASSNTEPVTYAQWASDSSTVQFSGTVVTTALGSEASVRVFTVGEYTPGSNNLQVYLNGVLQPLSTYVETSSTTVTMNTLPVADDEYTFVTNPRVSDASTVPASSVTFTQAGSGATASNANTKFQETVSVKDFGAAGDGSSDDAAAINAAISAVNLAGGGFLHFPEGTYLCEATVVPKANVLCRASFGSVILKLKSGTDAPLVESYLFDTLRTANAYQESDNADYTYNYGFSGFIFDCNKAQQASQAYGVKLYGRRLVLDKCIVANSKGVGLWTVSNGSHSGGYDYTKTKTPGTIGEIEIVDCVEEGWIFDGPSDQRIGQLVINETGDTDNDGTTPQTSTHFTGEDVHGLRVEDAMTIDSCNLNNTRFGRCLYVASGVRFVCDSVVAAGGWGNVELESNVWGSIGTLVAQANGTEWSGTNYPNVWCKTDDFIFPSATVLRVSGQDITAASCIKDEGGSSWGLVKSRQALAELGVFFEVAASGVVIENLRVSGADTALLTNSGVGFLNFKLDFNNCNLVWDNDATDVRGDWSISGTLLAGQVLENGVDSAPNADEESLANARIEFTDSGVWKSNSFRGTGSFDSTVTTGQSITVAHGMWRAPKIEEIQLSMRVSGWTTEGPQNAALSVSGFDATNIVARVKLGTAAGGTPTADQIVFRVN